MKLLKYLPLMVACLLSPSSLLAQDVTLGEATFGANSAATDPTWYDPMTGSQVYDGLGTQAGLSRTVTYSAGGIVAGVQTIKRHVEQTGQGGATEDLWIAFDALDDARVLKVERAGAAVYVASTEATPPLYLPSQPADGQSWEVAGTTVTVEWAVVSRTGIKVKINYLNAAGASHSETLESGKGVLTIALGEDSGWRLRPATVAPAPSPAP
jgi:hypothetical protein